MNTLAAARSAPPAAVRLSVALWLGAILAGVAETLVRLAGPAAPTAGELATRGGLYLVLAVLVVALRTGRDAIRWTVVVVLGVVGTLSLVVEPAMALLDGATVSFDCRISHSASVGTHDILYCEVLAVYRRDSSDALVYFSRSYHGLPGAV